jgi:antitoxin component YwqK of YwqJK toxin-antitoxin module
MDEPPEVDPDTLEYENGVFLFDGQLFTGLGVQRYPEGKKRDEVPFVNGREDGIARSWHRNGRLAGETTYVRGVKHGPRREWFDDGSLKSEELFEFDLLMRKEVRNERQEVIEHNECSTTAPIYQKIIERRKAGGPG